MASAHKSFLSPQSLEPPTVQAFAEASRLVSDLDELVRIGLLETYVDQYRIRRYRPTHPVQRRTEVVHDYVA